MSDDNSFVRRINEAAARFDSLRSEEKASLRYQVVNLLNGSQDPARDGNASSKDSAAPHA